MAWTELTAAPRLSVNIWSGAALAGVCAPVSADVAMRPAVTSAMKLASTADLWLVQSFIEGPYWSG